MTRYPGWDPSPTPYHHPPPGWPAPQASLPPDMSLMMGRILERTEATGDTLDRQQLQLDQIRDHLTQIDARLIKGDARMETIETAAEAHATELTALADKVAAQPVSPIPPIETLIKAALQYALPLLALWAIGATDAAKELITQAARAKFGG